MEKDTLINLFDILPDALRSQNLPTTVQSYNCTLSLHNRESHIKTANENLWGWMIPNSHSRLQRMPLISIVLKLSNPKSSKLGGFRIRKQAIVSSQKK